MPSSPAKKTAAKKAPAKKSTSKKAPAKKNAAAKPTVAVNGVKASARALSSFQEQFAKRFGADSIVRKGRAYRVVSTGSLTLDAAMGCGGYIVGRIVEIWGVESAHKTTMAMIAAANFQREFPDRVVTWIDMERTFDWDWARLHGMDTDRVMLFLPDNSEDVADMAKMAIESGLNSLVVLDSVGGMITAQEVDMDAEKASVGAAAKVITRMVKAAAVLCQRTETTMVVINQTRAIIGPQGGNTTGGGFALKHVTTHKIRLRRTGTDPYAVGTGDNKEIVGYEIAAHVEKNKVAPPQRVATFAIFNQDSPQYGPIGIDRAREAFTVGIRMGVISAPSTGYYVLPGEDTKIHGEGKTIARLREDPEMLETVRNAMLDRLAAQVADEVPEQDPEPEQPVSAPPLPGQGLDFQAPANMPEPEADFRMIDQILADEKAEASV